MADQALLDRLKRYSMKCLTERTDGDFAEAVWKSAEVIDGLLNDLQEALDTVDELQSQLPRWIPVAERLPDYDKVVLCHCRANIIETLCLENDGHWYGYSGRYMKGFVTHWMPLPEAPKEETDG